MRLVDAALPTFAKHETFHPRYGWFRKTYKAAADNPYVFTQENAPVELGVGKNMVRAIRFWGLAAKLIVEDPKAPNKRVKGCVPTRIGHAIFGEAGWDPYMEDPGTLWLLHWLLLAPLSRLPVWWLVFNEFAAVEFTDDDLEIAISTQIVVQLAWSENPAIVAPRLLDRYFGVPQIGVLAGYEGDEPVDDDLIEDLGYGRDPHSVIRRLQEPAALQVGVL